MSQITEFFSGECVPDGFDRWHEYRKKLTNFITDSVVEPQGIVFLGAGCCNDIDLLKLAKHYKDILLIDRDIEALKCAREQYKLSKAVNVSIMGHDFTSSQDGDIEEFEALLTKGEDVNSILSYIELIYNRDAGNVVDYIEMVKGKYNTIICAGVHSQLVIRYVALLDKYKDTLEPEDYNIIIKAIKGLSKKYVEQLDEYIYKNSLYKNIFVLYEYASFYRHEEEGMYFQEVYKKDGNIINIMAQDICNLFYNGCGQDILNMNLSRIDGAYQCEENISRMYHEGSICIEGYSYFVWPFSDEKEYATVCYLLSPVK